MKKTEYAKKSVHDLMETFSKNVSVGMENRVNKQYQKHRKFVREFFGINLPKNN